MKKILGLTAILVALGSTTFAQENESHEKIHVPEAVKSALHQKYPQATKVGWETENGNYEANWGGKDGEANSVLFTPSGKFIEIVKEIPVSQLPSGVISYVKTHMHTHVTEAGKVTDAKGQTSYEAEVHGKDVIFDANGHYVKSE